MTTCEFLVDKGRRSAEGVVREPCGSSAVMDEPGPNPIYKFHWCEIHATKMLRERNQ